MPLKLLLLKLLVFGTCFTLLAQNEKNTFSELLPTNAFKIELQFGMNLLGAGVSIKNGMHKSRLNGSISGWFGTSNYPEMSDKPEFGINAIYYITQRSGVKIGIGIIDWVRMIGRSQTDAEKLEINSQLNGISLNYVYRIRDNRNELRFGPLLYNYTIHALTETFGQSTDWRTIEKEDFYGIGINLAHVYKMASIKNKIDVGFKTEFSWVPSKTVGPYNRTNASSFRKSKINLFCLNMGITVGFISSR